MTPIVVTCFITERWFSGRCATIVGMDDIAAPDEAEILGTAVTASPLAADAPVRIPVHRYISAGFAELEYERMWPRVWHVACTMQIGLHQPGPHPRFVTLAS